MQVGYGALRGYLEMKPEMMPEVTRIESQFRKPGTSLADDLKLHLTDGRSWRIGKDLLGAAQRALIEAKMAEAPAAVHLIASGSVVLKPVPAGCTAAGVPARLVNCPTCEEPARSMDHTLAEAIYDYVI